MDTTETVGGNESMTRTAVILAGLTVLAMIVLNVAGADGPIWIVQGVLALATMVAAFRAGGTSPRNMPAFIAFLVGTVFLLAFLGFLIAEA
jgi:hypothetical protein